MPHATALGATQYVDDGTNGMAGVGGVNVPPVPETTFTPDGWPTTDRFVGPGDMFGSGIVVDIDADA